MSIDATYDNGQEGEESLPEGYDILDQYMKEIERHPRLSPQEEAELASRIRQGDQNALDRLVKAHLRFVVSVALEYRHKGLPLTDLINEGNIGLITAAKRFDETRGVRFISYAVWWIRQSIRQAFADHVRMIRLPRLQAEKLTRLEEDLRTHEQMEGQPVDLQAVIDDSAADNRSLYQLLAVSARPFSLDEPSGNDEEGSSKLDLLPDREQLPPDEQAIDRQLKSCIHQALDALPPREAHILTLYFGLNGDKPQTLESIAQCLGLSRERIRQIKEQGLQRLRHRSLRIRLRALL